MFINFWYPMALATELGDSPIKVQALGQSFALFRNADGAISCLADICIHRGGSLGRGKLKEGCIECPYHGWRYDGAGKCVHIPTLQDGAKIPARARVDAYPVQERYGVVFAFLGDLPENERPPIMDIPQWNQPGWSVTSMTYDWNASFDRVIENGLDATHTEFVHPSAGLQGGFKPGDHLEQKLVEQTWGSAYQMNSDELGIEHGHHGACQQWTFLNFRMKKFQGNFLFYSFVRPIDAGSVRRYLFHARDVQLTQKMDEEMLVTTLGFEKEDRPVIEDMRPRLSPRDAISELLLPEDQIMVRYRQWLNHWTGNGWQIDQRRMQEIGDGKAWVIPCPARRSSANWLFDPIPMIAAAPQKASRTVTS